MNESNLLVRAYGLLVFGSNLIQPVLLLIFRLYWGWQFFLTGKGKLINHTDVVQFFSSLHLPAPDGFAWFIGALECVGGLFLIAGLFSRPIALLLTGAMIGAYMAVQDDRDKVFNIFHNPEQFLTADPFFFLLTSLLVLSFGPGLFSLDALLAKFVFKKGETTRQSFAVAADQEGVHLSSSDTADGVIKP